VDAWRRRTSKAVWRQFDDSDNWVVHIPESAQVHLFTAAAHRLWNLVPEDASISTAGLSARLAAELKLDVDESLIRHIEATLAVMDHAGLTEPIAP
jgi:hypothetical protein